MANNTVGSYGKNYNIEHFVYPMDLVDNAAFSGNKVVFFINVASNSKKVKGDTLQSNGKEYDLWDVPEADQIKVSAGGETTRAIVDSANKASAWALKGQGTEVVEKAKIATGALKRLSVAIALYTPNSINQNTSVSWGEEDLSSVLFDMTDSATRNLSEGIDVVSESQGAYEKTKMGVGAAVAGTGGVIAAGASSAYAQTILKNARVQRFTRQTPGNSKQEVLFNSVNFREFDFNYQFTPKSSGEAKNVMNIIRMFKHHMLPEFANDAKSIYIYPSEFNVKYYKGNKENTYIEKQITAVLQSVGIDYTPNGQFNTFADGMPQQINMTLRFKELSTPSKETSPFDAHGV